MARVSMVPRDIYATETPLLPSEVRRGLKLSLGDGMLSQAHISLTVGAFLTGFALMLGAGNVTLGLLAALPFLIQPIQLLGAWLIERQGSRKSITVLGSLGRSLWLLVILLPYLPFSTTQRLSLLVTILLVSHALIAVCTNAWTNWMTDMVPARLRGRYFATRNTAMAAVAMVANYGGGLWLDRTRASGDLAHGYAILFGVAVLCGAISTLLLSRQPEPLMTRAPRLPIASVIRVPFGNAEFRRFMLTVAAWSAATGLAAPFFSAHALTVLGMSFAMLAMLDVITAGVSLVSLPLWGRVSDRLGHQRVLVIGMAAVVLLPLFWVIATPQTLWWLAINAGLSGIGWPAITLAQGNRLMERVPATSRGAYLAIFAATTGLAYFAASVAGGGLADALAGIRWSLGPLAINEYQTVFILSSLLRGSVALFGRARL